MSVKVQKCKYCAQDGESLSNIAADLNTDWLHLYTANPTVRDPDHLPSGTVVNTGVLYEVREGDYLELLADKFFTSTTQVGSLLSLQWLLLKPAMLTMQLFWRRSWV